MREAPARTAAIIDYPEPGTALTLLEDGRRVRGYYHVVRTDGRSGWIYYTFVRRASGDATAETAFTTTVPQTMSVH